jgi:hypothetical protein
VTREIFWMLARWRAPVRRPYDEKSETYPSRTQSGAPERGEIALKLG